MKLFVYILIAFLALSVPNVVAQDSQFLELLALFTGPIVPFFEHVTNIDHNLPMNNVARYFCINRKNPNLREIFMNDAEVKSKLNFSRPIAFIIHGWIGSPDHQWMLNLANYWIKYQNINVILVDWSGYASANYIYAATVNARITGYYIAEFIKFLVYQGAKLYETSVVGHSLGGQVAGFVGSYLDSLLGFIYALDPAGPCFTYPWDVGTANRLDPKDARFVQVIHTSSGILGAQINCGHQDFKPNKGTFCQPGCLFPFFADVMSNEPISCSHYRAIEDFQYSLNPANKFISIKCKNLQEYNNRSCTGGTDLLGVYSSRIPGEYYLITGWYIPFSTGRYY